MFAGPADGRGLKDALPKPSPALASRFEQALEAGRLFRDLPADIIADLCRYPRWLETHLGNPHAADAFVICDQQASDLASAADLRFELVFVGHSFLDPASVFGHLLLRAQRQTNEKPSLPVAITFLGQTSEFGFFDRLWHGVTGAMKGQFLLLPFHVQQRLYAQFESRDLFAFELLLSRQEKRRLGLLIGALKGQNLPYDFFHQNCAFRILQLIQEAAPGRHGIEAPHWDVPPFDVLRRLEAAGLVRSPPQFHASAQRKLWRRLQRFSDLERADYDRLIEHSVPLIEPDRIKPAVLAAGLLYFEVHHPFTLMGETDRPDVQKRYRTVLRLRSSQKPATEPSFVGDLKLDPLRGHPRRRVLLRMHRSSWQVGSDLPFLDVNVRLGMHGLLDRSQGHAPRGQVELFPFSIGIDPGEGRLGFRSGHFLNVQTLGHEARSLVPVWGLSLGFGETPSLPVADHQILGLHARYGLGWGRQKNALSWLGFLALAGQTGVVLKGALADVVFVSNPVFEDRAGWGDTNLAVEAALRLRIEPLLRGLAHCSIAWRVSDQSVQESCVGSLRISLGGSLDLAADWQAKRRFENVEQRTSLGLQVAY